MGRPAVPTAPSRVGIRRCRAPKRVALRLASFFRIAPLAFLDVETTGASPDFETGSVIAQRSRKLTRFGLRKIFALMR